MCAHADEATTRRSGWGSEVAAMGLSTTTDESRAGFVPEK
jgi:hypothetical protein